MDKQQLVLTFLFLAMGSGFVGGAEQTRLPVIPSPESVPKTETAEQESPPPNGSFQLLNSLVEEALRVNPSIQTARRSWAASSKRPGQRSSLPNPELTIGSMSSGNPLPYSTVGDGPLSWAAFMYTQKIPWPGKLRLQGQIAQKESAQEAQYYRAVTLDVVSQLKKNYFELHYLERAIDILTRYHHLLEQFSRIATARYSVGQGIQTDVLRSQVEISLIAERIEQLEGQRATVQARINTRLNRSPDAMLPRPKPIQDAPKDLPFSLERLYLMAGEENPSISADRLEIQKASLSLDLARKKLRPDFNLSATYMQRGGPFDNMYEYKIGIEIPLYFWRKERLGVEEKFEELERSRSAFQSRLQEVTFRIKDHYIGARTSRRLMELYRSGIIPQATAALDSALSAYEVGTVDFLPLVDNALTILNYEIQYQEELRDYFQNLAGLEELLGFVLVK